MAEQEQPSQITALAQYTIGLLLGSGVIGGALALAGGQGTQLYGLAAVFIFVGAAGLFYLAAIRADERRRREQLQGLSELYDDCFITLGQLLTQTLESGPAQLTKAHIFRCLISNLRTTARIRAQSGGVLMGRFQPSINRIADQWEDLASEGVPQDLPPEPRD